MLGKGAMAIQRREDNLFQQIVLKQLDIYTHTKKKKPCTPYTKINWTLTGQRSKCKKQNYKITMKI